ncbi:Guanylate cyclase (Partial), partial [Seminavis robusta]|eukprot:Sro2443_g327830.1 Guanylate cyclase (461) ;mRNA; r:2-2665
MPLIPLPSTQSFKVETVGDCYMASRIAQPCKDHYIVMCKFGRDILKRMRPICKRLTRSLGPDTCELRIRVGIHSDPSREESSEEKKVASSGCSSGDESDDLYVARHNPARGDLVPRPFSSSIGTPSSFNMMDASSRVFSTSITNAKFERLVAWNVEVLHRLLKQIVARRQCLVNVNPTRKADADESIYTRNRQGTLLDEVKESIELPTFNYSRVAAEQAQHIELDSDVYLQLQDYVRSVAELIRSRVPNFEHASHVTMSVSKLLSRITDTSMKKRVVACMTIRMASRAIRLLNSPACFQHSYTMPHPGVPNATLVKEQTPEAKMYKDRSVAESNSVDRCWRLLMEPKYGALRKTIYTTNNGLRRFRSLVVNSVMATDIGDKDLKVLRNGRWEKAFNTEGTADSPDESEKAAKDRKATIVIEHLIQASDVAHTMQHWHIYRKWNERLFQECYRAYKDGRAER